ncbi:hypothetical protein D3C74_364880 [compost metagenome]
MLTEIILRVIYLNRRFLGGQDEVYAFEYGFHRGHFACAGPSAGFKIFPDRVRQKLPVFACEHIVWGGGRSEIVVCSPLKFCCGFGIGDFEKYRHANRGTSQDDQ